MSSRTPQNDSMNPARRAFLRRTGQLALTGTALPFALNMAAIGEASAFTATDYKALVCVFLYGGNDYANTVVTFDNASYDAYSRIRGGGANRTAGGIALAQADLQATLLKPTTPLPDARQYALHPSMGGLAALFNSGAAAVMLNVGTLVKPLTRAQYNSADRVNYPLPPKLFSHNDQQSVWQSSASEGATQGWGGRLGDLALANNGNSLFTCMNVTGNAVFLSGQTALSYQVSPSGPVAINGVRSAVYGSADVQAALSEMIQQSRSHVLEQVYNQVTGRAIGAERTLNGALGVNTTLPAFAGMTSNPLAMQLNMVARTIAARNSLGNKRQVFFVSMGGFDLHDGLMLKHGPLLQNVSAALSAFYQATVDLGVQQQVTAFTASDFGRTLTSNGDGSDHGWGSHHLIVGGAVKGQAFYGQAPAVSVTDTSAATDQGHVGQGRLLPTTSVDQYAATLGKWFGASDAELLGILPNLKNFGAVGNRPDYPVDVGFMNV